MTVPLSLSALRALRAKMTQGLTVRNRQPHLGNEEDAWHTVDDNDGRAVFGSAYTDLEWPAWKDNAAGIVATHNAADVLLEIAEALMAYCNAEDHGTGDASWEAERRMRAALAKVAP